MFNLFLGRISLMHQRGSKTKWLFVEHRCVSLEEIQQAISECPCWQEPQSAESEQKQVEESITLRFEPFILAVECSSLQYAGINN